MPDDMTTQRMDEPEPIGDLGPTPVHKGEASAVTGGGTLVGNPGTASRFSAGQDARMDSQVEGTGFFTSVGGLSLETEVVDYREGGTTG